MSKVTAGEGSGNHEWTRMDTNREGVLTQRRQERKDAKGTIRSAESGRIAQKAAKETKTGYLTEGSRGKRRRYSTHLKRRNVRGIVPPSSLTR